MEGERQELSEVGVKMLETKKEAVRLPFLDKVAQESYLPEATRAL